MDLESDALPIEPPHPPSICLSLVVDWALKMKSLSVQGALTHGDRRATESRDLSRFNIDNRYGRAALESVMKSILTREPGVVDTPKSYTGNFFRGRRPLTYTSFWLILHILLFLYVCVCRVCVCPTLGTSSEVIVLSNAYLSYLPTSSTYFIPVCVCPTRETSSEVAVLSLTHLSYLFYVF